MSRLVPPYGTNVGWLPWSQNYPDRNFPNCTVLRGAATLFKPKSNAADRMVNAGAQVDLDETHVFTMSVLEQNRDVVQWLRTHSDRPMIAVVLWAELLTALERSTGEIQASRQQLADRVGTSARNVSRVMAQLKDFGIINKRHIGREAKYYLIIDKSKKWEVSKDPITSKYKYVVDLA